MTEPIRWLGELWSSPDPAGALRWVLTVVLAVLAAMVLVVGARRFTGGFVERRRARLVQRSRPLLLEVLSDESVGAAGMTHLAELPEREWRLVEPMIVTMLGKVRGEARGSLVGVLARRGTLLRAERRSRARSWVRRCEAAEMLGAAREYSSARVLIPLLSDHRGEVRRVAARALGRIGSRDAVPALLAVAVGPRRLPAREVASSLVLLEPSATGLIMAAGEADDSRVQAVVAEVLGLRGAVEATTLLVDLLRRGKEHEVRIRAARALGRLGVRQAAVPLIEALESTSGELRAVAARALGQLGSADAVVRLVGCLEDPSHRVAANAAESLAALGEPGLDALRVVASSAREREAGYAREALAVHGLGRRSLERAGA